MLIASLCVYLSFCHPTLACTLAQVPPRTLNPFRDGAFGWIKREGVAYVSNMAVLPQARRMGTARALMEVSSGSLRL
jgi:ribosomal protein S18 acetylase RimI-like enzyme